MIGINSLIIVAVLVLQTADGFTWTSPEGVTGFVRAALPDAPAALPIERNSHAAVAVDSDLLILGGESNTELVQEMCMIDTEQQVTYQGLFQCMCGFKDTGCYSCASCKYYLHMTTSHVQTFSKSTAFADIFTRRIDTMRSFVAQQDHSGVLARTCDILCLLLLCVWICLHLSYCLLYISLT